MNRIYTASMLLLVFAASASAQGFHLSLDTSGGGGFTGLNSVSVQTVPNTVCDSASPPKCSIDPNNVVLIRNASYTWQPALAVGLTFRIITPNAWKDQDGDGIGFGPSGQFVFLPSGTGTTAAPAATFNIGTQSKQLFFGVLFAKASTADIPGGGSRAIVPIGFPSDAFVLANSGRVPAFFAGIILAGKSVTSPGASPTAKRP
jgi:hypothetical protein